jgi:hypothetical protein
MVPMPLPWMAAKIVLRPAAELRPHAGNARVHSVEQLEPIKASMLAFGFTNPLLVDEGGELIARHGRLEAAIALGIAKVSVIVLRHLTPAQKDALRLADNRIAENATWDQALLRDALASLQQAGDIDLLAIGFSSDEISTILAAADAAIHDDEVSDATDAGAGGESDADADVGEAAEPEPDPADAEPEPPRAAVTCPGDLWLLGAHRLLCGDSTDAACVARVMGGEGACYVCMSSSEWPTLHRAWQDAGGKWSSTIIWAKNTFALGRADYHQQFEAMLYGWKAGSQHYWCGARDQGNVWHFDKPARNDLHPTIKPVALVERAIRNSSKQRDTVLDLFGGSGTTLIAAERTGRQAVLIEIDPCYVDVVVRRWQEATGQEAVLEDGGRRFNEIAAGPVTDGHPPSRTEHDHADLGQSAAPSRRYGGC